MIIIECWRYVATLETKVADDGNIFNIFNHVYDHSLYDDSNKENINQEIEKWLKDHYGFCVVYLSNTDFGKNILVKRIDNKHKTQKDLYELGVNVLIKQGTHV